MCSATSLGCVVMYVLRNWGATGPSAEQHGKVRYPNIYGAFAAIPGEYGEERPGR